MGWSEGWGEGWGEGYRLTCAAPVIMLGMKSLCPGASSSMTCLWSVSNSCWATSIVTPLGERVVVTCVYAQTSQSAHMMCTCIHDYISETHQTRQGNTPPPTETAHFLFFSKKK